MTRAALLNAIGRSPRRALCCRAHPLLRRRVRRSRAFPHRPCARLRAARCPCRRRGLRRCPARVSAGPASGSLCVVSLDALPDDVNAAAGDRWCDQSRLRARARSAASPSEMASGSVTGRLSVGASATGCRTMSVGRRGRRAFAHRLLELGCTRCTRRCRCRPMI